MEEELKVINGKLDYIKYKIKNLEQHILINDSCRLKYEAEKNYELKSKFFKSFNASDL
jgi:hypothetical protein